jgi:tRNA-dihydrouridine synthase
MSQRVSNFSWQRLPKPFTVLAPMEDVTDTVFRRIVGHMGKPDVFFTEFTSSDGYISKGKEYVGQRLEFTEEERPIIAQLWGSDPDHLQEATKMVAEMGFDGIDLNLGCPEKNVLKNGAGGALIGNYSLVKELVYAMKEGIGEAEKLQIPIHKLQTNSNNLNSKNKTDTEAYCHSERSKESLKMRSFGFQPQDDKITMNLRHLNESLIPLSIKTRIGNKQIITEEWISFLLTLPIDAIIIHGRTVKELSKVPCHWDEIGKAVTLRNTINPHIMIIGNGDVESYQEIVDKYTKNDIDGVMVGRGIFTNPHVFRKDGSNPNKTLLLQYLKQHLKLFESHWKGRKNYAVMKKFYKMYVNGWDGAKALREKLMETKNVEEAIEIVESSL